MNILYLQTILNFLILKCPQLVRVLHIIDVHVLPLPFKPWYRALFNVMLAVQFHKQPMIV